MVRYLSPDWIGLVHDVASADDDLREAMAGASFCIQQLVTDTPNGTVAYHLVVDHGEVAIREGRAERPDVTLSQDYDTALGVTRGTLNAQRAFMTGRVKIAGDTQVLLDNQARIARLDGVFKSVQEQTDY